MLNAQDTNEFCIVFVRFARKPSTMAEVEYAHTNENYPIQMCVVGCSFVVEHEWFNKLKENPIGVDIPWLKHQGGVLKAQATDFQAYRVVRFVDVRTNECLYVNSEGYPYAQYVGKSIDVR